MKGKKKQQEDAAAVLTAHQPAQRDLSVHSAFFDSLVELVPAKYYFEPEEPLLNLKYTKKADRAEAKRALKEQYRKNKRAKLDPDAVQSTLEVQQARADKHQPAEPLDVDAREGGDVKEGPARLSFHGQNGKAASLEELRDRLQARLKGMRDQRHADEKQKKAQSAKDWRSKAVGRKLKPQQKQSASRPADPTPAAVASNRQPAGKPAALPITEDISYGQLRLPAGKGKQRQKKVSKAQQLEALKQKAQQSPSNQEAWNKALARAQGQKVYDDPKRLQRSVKREQKQKEKKAKAWRDRIKQQDRDRSSKQARRNENLKARADTKIQKKDRRDKRLMRPGFEGRRDTFIS